MNKIECKNILDFIQFNYTNYKITEEMINAWFDELQQYDYQDVLEKLKDMTSREIYQMKPPTLMAIVNDLPKVQEKIARNKSIVYCNYCGRALPMSNKDLTQMHIHENRCRSVNYINKKYSLRYKSRELTREEKRKLYQMTDEEFNKYYDDILKYIQSHTENELEKNCINNIFNPPNKETINKIFDSIK